MAGVVVILVEVSSGRIAARVVGSGRHREPMLPMGDDVDSVVAKLVGWRILQPLRSLYESAETQYYVSLGAREPDAAPRTCAMPLAWPYIGHRLGEQLLADPVIGPLLRSGPYPAPSVLDAGDCLWAFAGWSADGRPVYRTGRARTYATGEWYGPLAFDSSEPGGYFIGPEVREEWDEYRLGEDLSEIPAEGVVVSLGPDWLEVRLGPRGPMEEAPDSRHERQEEPVPHLEDWAWERLLNIQDVEQAILDLGDAWPEPPAKVIEGLRELATRPGKIPGRLWWLSIGGSNHKIHASDLLIGRWNDRLRELARLAQAERAGREQTPPPDRDSGGAMAAALKRAGLA